MIINSKDIKGKITHLTNKENFNSIINEGYKVGNRTGSFKPKGLWLSWEGGWEQWTKENNYRWKESTLKVELDPDLKILLIDSLNDFKEVYINQFKGKDIKWGSDYKEFWGWLSNRVNGVALTSKGERETKLNTFLYGWDCQCILLFKPLCQFTTR